MTGSQTPRNKKPFSLPDTSIVPSVRLPSPPKISVEQAMKIAFAHQKNGQLPQAESVLRDILAAVPDHAPALHLLGVVAHQAGNTDSAVALIERAIAADGNNALYHANIGEMYRRTGNLEQAIKHGQAAVALAPDMVAAHANLGIAYYDREEMEKAERAHEEALALNPRFAPSLNNMGSILRHRNEPQAALDYFRRAVDADATYLDAQNNLAEILTRLEQPREALAILDAVLKKNPRFDSAHTNMGQAFLALGQEEQCRKAFMRALTVNPDSVAAYAGYTLAMLEFHRLDEGIVTARKLMDMVPDKPDAFSMLGSLLVAKGETEEAEAAYKQALDIDPAYRPARMGMGHILMEKGDLAGAEDLFRACMADEKGDAFAVYSLVQVKKIKEGDPEIEILEREAERLKGPILDSRAISLNFALGKMYDDLGQYEKGFPYYIEGCRIKRKRFNYSMEEKEAVTQRTKNIFTKEFIAQNRGRGHDDATPIFVLGMPRSGTTLTEQIIASHPSVFGAGELPDLSRMMFSDNSSFLDKIQGLKPGDLASWGRRYAESIRRFSADAPHITDKMPGNYHYLGFIPLILPRAKIVHVSRHPLDTCLSCFTRSFSHGQANTYDLTEIGHAYKCYKDLMDHWQAVLPEGSFYNIRYETLVDDTENEARKLIEYCGLEWDESCLAFYKNTRKIRTASVTQVRQPIYKTSKERWRNYEKFLGPLIAALGPALDGEI